MDVAGHLFADVVSVRALSWNPAVKRYCRARLQNFDVVAHFGLYDLLGPAVAGACCVRRFLMSWSPSGCSCRLWRNFLLKSFYHFAWGRRLFDRSERRDCHIGSGSQGACGRGVPSGKIVLRRNGVEIPVSWLNRERSGKLMEYRKMRS